MEKYISCPAILDRRRTIKTLFKDKFPLNDNNSDSSRKDRTQMGLGIKSVYSYNSFPFGPLNFAG